uniref:Uncharacterized protein n=1 Tax=Strongyloides papillosus TaxID=174720 RepID=A0A0N5C2V5_STREA
MGLGNSKQQETINIVNENQQLDNSGDVDNHNKIKNDVFANMGGHVQFYLAIIGFLFIAYNILRCYCLSIGCKPSMKNLIPKSWRIQAETSPTTAAAGTQDRDIFIN